MSEQKGLIAPAPHDCPGTQSENSGKASACEGCPNQQICSTAPKGPDPDLAEIVERLSGVKNKFLVLSGKGGVGKSTFSTLLSQALAMKAEELQVGLLDIDICGPSIPIMVGAQDEQVHHSNSGWSPVSVKDNLVVMSVGFFLSDQNDAVIWRGPKKNDLIKKFLKEVDWGNLDYLILDTPPGTSDEHLSVVSYLKNTVITGAVVITTPQEISLMDVRKEINFCIKTGVPIIGVVENMSTFVCPKCNTETKIFAPTTGGAEKMAKDMGVPFLGRIPLDPRIAKSCDQGKNFLEEWPETEAAKAYFRIVDEIIKTKTTKKSESNV